MCLKKNPYPVSSMQKIHTWLQIYSRFAASSLPHIRSREEGCVHQSQHGSNLPSIFHTFLSFFTKLLAVSQRAVSSTRKIHVAFLPMLLSSCGSGNSTALHFRHCFSCPKKSESPRCSKSPCADVIFPSSSFEF